MVNWIAGNSAYLMLVVGAVLAVGAVFVDRIPVISKTLAPYKWAALALGLALTHWGMYLKGAANERLEWQVKVAQAEARVAVAEEKARTTAAQIETVYVDRVKEIVKNRNIIKERIVVVTERIDSQCKVDPVVIDILNDAAMNKGATQ